MTLKKLDKIDADFTYFETIVSLALDKRYMRKDGTYNVSIVIYHEKSYYFYQTGLRVKKWNDASYNEQKNVRKSFDRATELVSQLIDQEAFSFSDFKTLMNAPKIEKFHELMEERIKELRVNKQFSTAYHYEAALKVYTTVLGETTFNQINSNKMKKLLEYMKEPVNGKQRYSDTTINIYFSDIRSVVNQAIEKGLMKQANDPFKGKYDKIKLPEPNDRHTHFLKKDEMMRVFDYYEKTHNEYIGLFLFSYLAGGMNIVDILQLKYNDDYFDNNKMILSFVRSKTAYKNKKKVATKIVVSPALRSLIPQSDEKYNSYVFPYLRDIKEESKCLARRRTISNLVNYHLKKMSEELGFDKVVTPTFARHSFATILRAEFVPSDFIEYTMAHSLKGSAKNYAGNEFNIEQLLKFSSYLVA